MLSLLLLYFNPLHHEGGDLLDLASMAPAQVISIHSTTRVETHEMCESGEIPYISIHSTTRVETLNKNRATVYRYISIHSTTRVETVPGVFERALRHNISIHSTTRVETGPAASPSDRTLDFNPLHHEGGDLMTIQIYVLYHISIHSTTRVETAILHNNHYYSSTHFHKQIISHPLKSRPTIPAHSQIRSHCANFPVRISP